jgi:hypothetical protein
MRTRALLPRIPVDRILLDRRRRLPWLLKASDSEAGVATVNKEDMAQTATAVDSNRLHARAATEVWDLPMTRIAVHCLVERLTVINSVSSHLSRGYLASRAVDTDKVAPMERAVPTVAAQATMIANSPLKSRKKRT